MHFMRRNIPSPQREINDLEPPVCFYYALKSVNLTVPRSHLSYSFPRACCLLMTRKGQRVLYAGLQNMLSLVNERLPC